MDPWGKFVILFLGLAIRPLQDVNIPQAPHQTSLFKELVGHFSRLPAPLHQILIWLAHFLFFFLVFTSFPSCC